MRFRLTVTGLGVALVLFAALPAVSPAANKKGGPEKPAIEERAALILEQACKDLTGLKGFSFQAEVTLDRVYQDGSKIQSGRSMTVTVQRPAAFRVVTDGDEFKATSVFDGKTFSVALPERKLYAQIPAALDTDGLMDMLASHYGIESPLGDLLSNQPCAQMKARAGFYVGKAKVDGAACDHLFFQGKDVDWQLWIEDGPVRLPRKIVITEKKLRMSPQFTAVLSGWKTAETPLDQFAFSPPEGYSREDGVITGTKPARGDGGRP